MAQYEVYNEGRVVGLSAYELYVRQFLLESPDGTPASEKEWLASSIASGASLLIEVPIKLVDENDSPIAEDQYHYVDISLPSTTSLCAANTIIGTWVDIDPNTVTINDETIVNGIKSYSDYMLPNKPSLHPNSGNVSATDLPVNPNLSSDVPISDIDGIREYVKIVDGMVLQSGDWSRTNTLEPYMKMDSPDFSTAPVVRLIVRGAIYHPFYILLTGFTDNTIVSGVTGTECSWGTNAPQNGDFLGPATFPWGNKIIFVVNSAVEYALSNSTQPIYLTIPEFEANKYYSKSGDTYSLLVSKPASWEYVIDADSESYINCYVSMPNVGYAHTLPIGISDTPNYMTKFGSNYLLLPAVAYSANPIDVLDSGGYADGTGYITWAQLFRALFEDKKVRVSPWFVDTLNNNITWNSTDDTFEFNLGVGIKVGKNYIDFNGVRLYVSSSEPTGDIPNGSIGIGWSTQQ